jgi:predicted nucleic acid-binding protein
MTVYCLDTNTLSFLVRNEEPVVTRFTAALAKPNIVLICPFVWFEVQRGLLARDAKSQFAYAETLIGKLVWRDYERQDWELAARLWMKRRLAGRPIADADLLIAVFAINRDAVLVTDNERDFAELGAKVQNWK